MIKKRKITNLKEENKMKDKRKQNGYHIVSIKIPSEIYENLRLQAVSENTFVTSICYKCLEENLFQKSKRYEELRKKLMGN